MSAFKTPRQLLDAVEHGIHPVMSFTAAAADLDCYLEKGMRARVIGGFDGVNGMVHLVFDLAEFESLNVSLEQVNQISYASGDRELVTPRQSGRFRRLDDFTLAGDASLEEYMTVVPDERTMLYEAYAASPVSAAVTYVSWLEDAVLHMHSTAALLKQLGNSLPA